MNETGGYPLDFIGFFCETVRHHAGRWWSGARWYHLDFIGFFCETMRHHAGRSGAREDPVVVWRPGHKVLWDIKPYGVCRDALTLTVAVVNGYLKALTIEAQ